MDEAKVAGVLKAAATDAREARWHFHPLVEPFAAVPDYKVVALLTDVWAFAPDRRRVLLVDHPRRGWVMPGGNVEPGETVRAAAVRELAEETGVILKEPALTCAAITGGVAGDLLKIGLSYVAVVNADTALRAEPDQPAQWWSLEDEWPSIYPHDRQRLLDQAALMR